MPITGAAATALDERVIRPAWFGYLDFNGDPIRATTWKAPVSFSGTGDTDLDGFTFTAIDHELVEVGAIETGESGSGTVRVELSGLIGVDTDLLNLVGTRSNWSGRVMRLWIAIYDESGTQLSAVGAFYTGYMNEVRIIASPEGQRIMIDCENYLTAFSQASNRSYMDQEYYDSGDLSAKAAIATANNNDGSKLTGGSGDGGGGGGGGRGDDPPRWNLF